MTQPLTLDTDMLLEFECPICTDTMHPPIRLCIMGHTFCQRCYTRLNWCATCRQPKSQGRNFALERCHGKLPFACKRRHLGCQHIDVGSKIQQHEEECSFGKVECPLKVMNDCTWSGNVENVIDHCHDAHPHNVFVTDKQKLTCANFRQGNANKSSYYIMFQVKEELFKCAWEVDFATGLMKWCVYHLGTPELSRNFSFQLNVEDRLILQADCPTLTPNEDTDELKDECCILTHFEMLKKMCVEDDLVYTITIIDKTVERVTA